MDVRAALGLGLIGTLAAGAVGLVAYGAQQLTRTSRESLAEALDAYELPAPEVVELVARDGPRLSAWWFESPTARASVVAVHGHGGSKAASLWMASHLFPDFNVLLVDVRGHGESPGDVVSVGYLERLDVIAGAEWLIERNPRQRVGAFGISMGAVACILAAADGPAISAVVADSPFDRLSVSVRQSILGRGYPKVLADTLPPLIQHAARYRLRLLGQPWLDPIDVVHRIAPRPILIMHGDADTLTPVEGARALYAAAGEPKELWIEPGVPHANLAAEQPAAYHARIQSFLHRWLDVPVPAAINPGQEAGEPSTLA